MRTRQHETTEMLEQKKTNSNTPVDPTKDRESSTNQYKPKLNFKQKKQEKSPGSATITNRNPLPDLTPPPTTRHQEQKETDKSKQAEIDQT